MRLSMWSIRLSRPGLRIALLFLALLCAAAIPQGRSKPQGRPEPQGQSEPPEAAAAILRLEDRREASAALLSYLSSPDAAIRARASLALGRIGSAEAIGPLASLLRDPEADVRAAAAFALGEIEDSSAADPLASLLHVSTERAAHVRALSIEGLGKHRASRQVGSCMKALEDSSREVREAACLAAWQMQAAEAWSKLVILAQDPEAELRWKATYALMRMIGTPASGRTPIPGGVDLAAETREEIQKVLLERARDPDLRARLAAVRGLGSFGDSVTEEVLRVALGDADWRVRVEAVRALATPAKEATGQSRLRSIPVNDLQGVLSDPNPNVRLSALEALGRLGAEGEAVSVLQASLRSSIPREREVAALSLAERLKAQSDSAAGAERVATLQADLVSLARLVADSDIWSLRAVAAEVAAGSGVIDSVLFDHLLKDDPRVAKTAVEPWLKAKAARRRAGDDILSSLQPDLDRLLASPDPVVRSISLEAVGSILGDSTQADPPDGWISLLQRGWARAQQDQGNDVALTIVGFLEKCTSSPEAVSLLQAAATARDDLVRREAVRILRARGMSIPEGGGESGRASRSLEEYATILRWAQQDREVEIRTGGGRIRIRLFTQEAPMTCWNFVRLAQADFYDQGSWHRIVPDFVVQDGCPRGDGYGGPGYTIRCEINEHRYETGSVGMALSGKDTGGSQFFITHSPQPHLDGRYTVFGQVVEGQEIVDRLIQGDRIETIRACPSWADPGGR